jgi:hypothetical protein
MKFSRILLVAAALLVMSVGSASAQSYDDAAGGYVKAGLALGWANSKGVATAPLAPDVGTAVGFDIAVGRRINAWLAADVELYYVGGADVKTFPYLVTTGSATNVGVTGNVKGYPLGAFAPDLMPQWIQPYGTFGLGIGMAEVDQQPDFVNTFGSTNELQFLARFGMGVDVLISDHWGVYVDGNYYITNKEQISGIGTLVFGGSYRF